MEEGREKKCVTAERTTLTSWEAVMLKLFNVTCVARSDEHTQRVITHLCSSPQLSEHFGMFKLEVSPFQLHRLSSFSPLTTCFHMQQAATSPEKL